MVRPAPPVAQRQRSAYLLRIIVAIGAAVRLRASLDWLGALETPR